MIYSPEMIRRIEAVTSSLRGVVRSRVQSEGGVVHRIRVAVEPDKDPARAAAEVRSALLSSLGVEVQLDEIDVRVVEASKGGPPLPEPGPTPSPEPKPEPTAGPSPEPRPEAGPGATPPEPEPGVDRPASRPGGAPAPPPPSAATRPEPEPTPEPRPPEPASPGPAEEGAGAPPALRLREFAVFGGRGHGVELRVRIEDDGEVHDASLRLEDLDALDASAFVHAVLRAAESALDARPAGSAGRILLLDPVDVEETKLREGSFAAVTVEARFRRGRRRATGFAPLRGSLREAAARAALDAVTRLVDPGFAGSDPDAPSSGDPSPPIDPFDVWD